MHKILYIVGFILMSTFASYSQKVTISKELSIRNDRAYDILGKIGDKILLYRDLGSKRVVEIFENDLKFFLQEEIRLPGDNQNIYAVVPQDSTFNVLYGHRNKEGYFMRTAKFDKYGRLKDSLTLIDGVEDFKLNNFTYKVSDDRSKTLLFSSRKNDLFYTYIIDNNTMDILWSKETKLLGLNVRKDFRSIDISNSGEVNILFEINNTRYLKDEHQLIVIGLDYTEGYYENNFWLRDKIAIDLEMDYDNINNRLVLGGLVSETSEIDASGYFYFSKPVNEISEDINIETHDFRVEFLEELYGKKLSKKKKLSDFITRDIVLRSDGGFLMFTEMKKEFFRRTAFNAGVRSGVNGARGWVDIYNEDIIVFAFNPDGTEDWKKILYKKQFSQDDDGVYSSFFIFETPSRLRLIYNDEIKRNNTVSEYVLDPLGNFERNSLLSTDYQNLKLRFRDAVQVSSDVMIVPSERNYKLNLVRVEYE